MTVFDSIRPNSEGDGTQLHLRPGEGMSLLSLVSDHGGPGSQRTGQPLAPGSTSEHQVNVGSEKRNFGLHIPKNWDGKSPLPVLYYFNGLRPDGKPEPETFTGLSERADKMGFALVYMRASNQRTQTFNNGQKIFANSKDESAYLNAVHTVLGETLPLDNKRQGTAGFSLGGNEAYSLAASNAWIASAQSVEGYMSGYEPPLNHPVSEQNIHALHDPIIPQNGTEQVCAQADREAQAVLDSMQYGGEGYIDPVGTLHAVTCMIEKDGNMIQPQRYIVDTFRRADGISTPPQIFKTPDFTIYNSRNPSTGVEVRQVTLAEGTHGWAGSADHSGDMAIIGQPNEKFSASDAIARFFLEHPLPE
jgi:poly(3-hydroxybutyrate) depolymerase